MSEPSKVSAVFVVEDNKKHSVKFKEAPDDPATPEILGTAYIKKHVLMPWGNPSKVRITIEPA